MEWIKLDVLPGLPDFHCGRYLFTGPLDLEPLLTARLQRACCLEGNTLS